MKEVGIMDRKEVFINYISKNKLKKITSIELANIIESAFKFSLNFDVWQISDPNIYSELRNKIILDKSFKKKDRKAYKLFLVLSKHYQIFLKTEYTIESGKKLINENDHESSKQNSLDCTTEEPTVREGINVKEIYDFFGDYELAQKFYQVFKFASKQIENLILDVRVSIIGAKINGERLRFYSDKGGTLKFIKLNLAYKMADASFNVEKIFKSVIDVNKYFLDHSDEITLNVKFDGIEDNKTIREGQSSYEEIAKEDYLNKIKPNEQVGRKSALRLDWDQFETALLIEAFWKIENKQENRTVVLNELSDNLRTRAVKRGIKIDETFRNINGMNIQLANIALSFFPDRSAIHRTAIFDTIANIYKNDRQKFNHILDEAHKQVNGINNNLRDSQERKNEAYSIAVSEVDFYSFIKETYYEKHKSDGKGDKASLHAKKCIDLVRRINKILVNNKYKLNSVYEINDTDEIFRVMSFMKHTLSGINEKEYKWYMYVLIRYKSFINQTNEQSHNNQTTHALLGDWESVSKSILSKNIISRQSCFLKPEKKQLYPDYANVLREYFSDGFAYGNLLRKRKFIKAYEEINGKTFNDSDDDYISKLATIGFESEEKIYLSSIIPEKLKSELVKFIENNLNKETSVIYFSVIYDLFIDKLPADFSYDMLVSYLKFEFADDYIFEKEYISKKGNIVNFKQDVINVFMNAGCPLNIEEIYSKLPNLSHSAIDSLINDRDFIVNYKGKSYFYINLFVVDDEQLNDVREFIADTIDKKDQLSGNELNTFIKDEIPELLELNPKITDLGLKNALKYFLDNEFSFKGDVISGTNKKIDVKELYHDFCRKREKFSFEELEAFRDSIHKRYIDYNAVFDISIRVNEKTYIRRDLIDFDVERIDNAILKYCRGKYVSYSDIINFIEFPTTQYPWNNYLLEGYLFCESKKFKVINASFNKEKPVGAIVRKQAFENFDDLIVDVIKEHKLFNKEKAFEYLQDNDFIFTKKFKNIDLLISKAKM